MKYKCVSCGKCCIAPNIILLTDSDLKRLKKGWWNETEFTEMYVSFAVKEGTPDSSGITPRGFERYPLVELDKGIKGWLMLGQKTAEDSSGIRTCFFLEGAIAKEMTFCRTYDIRPMMCRLYPVSWILDKYDNQTYSIIPEDRFESCKGFSEESEELNEESYGEILTTLYSELVQYENVVKCWNERKKKGNLLDFIKYLLGEEDVK